MVGDWLLIAMVFVVLAILWWFMQRLIDSLIAYWKAHKGEK